jgi:HAD superfamily hydrolase (TIGR01509 family)
MQMNRKKEQKINFQSKVIALDIGNVCVSLRYDKCFRALNLPEDTKVPDSFLETVYKLETGRITVKKWLEQFRTVTDGKFSDRELVSAYNQILGKEIDATSEFVKAAAAKGFRVIFFSNISEIHALAVYEKLSFSHLITGAVFSYETGYMKPEKEIYERFMELYGTPVLFIDDKEENRSAAEKLNWKTKETVPSPGNFF